MRTVDDAALSRHLVRLDPGDELMPTIESLARVLGWSQAFVTGAGVLDLVELLSPTGEQETFANAELVALTGTIMSGPAGPTAALRATMTCQGTLVSGRILAAIATEVLLLIDAVTDEADRRQVVDEATVDSPGAPQAPSSPAPPASVSAPSEPVAAPVLSAEPEAPAPAAIELQPADDTAMADPPPVEANEAASTTAVTAEELPLSAPKPPSRTFRSRPIPRRIGGVRRAVEEDEAVPDPGDFLDHPQLGLCEVEGTDDAGGTVIIVPSGRRRTLRLEALRVLPPVEDDQGRRVLKVVGPKRRR